MPVAAQEPQAPGVPIHPMFMRRLDQGEGFRSAVVSPDGQSIYAVATVPMTDIGILINTHALAFSSTAAGLLAAAALLWIWRKAFRRKTVGAMHCRRCDYIVTGLATAARCPECGVDLAKKRPRAGQSALRRLIAPVALLLIVAGAYGWFATLGRKAYPWPVPVQRWGSTILAGWADNPRLTWIKDATFEGQLLLEIDPQTGATRRVIAKRPTMALVQLAYNPAADGLYLASNFDAFDLVSVRNGRTIASLAGHPPADATGDFVLGHDKTGDKTYLSYAQTQSDSWVTEWNWRTGEFRTLFTTPGWTDGRYRSSRLHLRIPGEPMRFLRVPSDSELIATRTSRVSVVDERGQVIVEADLGPRLNARRATFTADGSMIFMADGGVGGDGGRGGLGGLGGSIVALDTNTLKPVGELSVGGIGQRSHTVRPDGRLMFITDKDRLLVRDIQAKAWVATLNHPSDAYGPRSLGFSADGRTVCAVFQSSDPTTGGFYFQLGAWRLPESLGVEP